MAETRAALMRAPGHAHPATTGVIVLRNDTLGFVIYDPIVVRDRLIGYVGAAVAYAPLLRALLTPRLQGRFGYRIADSAGRLLAVSPQYPTRVRIRDAAVSLPGGGHWRLDVPIGVFQPRGRAGRHVDRGTRRVCSSCCCSCCARTRAPSVSRSHSFNLELLSRDLLDANVRLEERAQQVTEANKAKSRFLANVSHELRTPLNAIVGYNALALSGLYGEVTAELRGAHDRIRTAADHLLHVVNDVLDLSKIEVGRMAWIASGRARAVARGGARDRGAGRGSEGRSSGLVVARDIPAIVTDARHVRQISMNLMTNAIKFTERGSVTVVAKLGEGARMNIGVDRDGGHGHRDRASGPRSDLR